jgi:type II secretory ATPase GspE/PulE/Tfp pilus assembly ATPase PilB-like protein
MNTTDNREAFYASVRAIDALCPACKQPQNAPSCERREHVPTRWSAQTTHDPALCGQCAEGEYTR